MPERDSASPARHPGAPSRATSALALAGVVVWLFVEANSSDTPSPLVAALLSLGFPLVGVVGVSWAVRRRRRGVMSIEDSDEDHGRFSPHIVIGVADPHRGGAA